MSEVISMEKFLIKKIDDLKQNTVSIETYNHAVDLHNKMVMKLERARKGLEELSQLGGGNSEGNFIARHTLKCLED